MQAHEGRLSSRFTETVTQDKIRLFCESVGAQSSKIAPPTFLTVFRAGEFELFDQMGLKLANVLHGEQQYSYLSEIHAGDEVSFQTRLSSVMEKRAFSGKMSFLVFDTEIDVVSPESRKAGISSRRAGAAKTTVIAREKG